MQDMMIIASLLVFLNVTLLTILVPGGPIENRDFSKLTGVVFWGFNLFLISLGVVSFIACYLLLISHSNAILITQMIAVLYFIVYTIDLAGMFPKSPTKMSKPLMLFEIINTTMAVFLFLFVTAIGHAGS
ncbi:hypothetical protein PC41400_03595 [Paenibacillus chitinolyticus]|uniref:DUF8051 domain-containing protein n=1 Tax=Paenibacillus chitinolyticus TaxID=79263 RepID=A0A410WQV9_9BACL|nr:hypothetical protein [Paenibacillus chitinolyticus]MCY9591594.1 hypothetical protein [Paenibacillus chitinolyticus]MCY9594573.1 hypothetical protein [Paenibacillus chitinolyticus]QAV16818.1 hypothetical protein PC41400_03595 [Paenibacillus chitinolyticus]